MDNNGKKWLRYDPVIHLGHILTALSFIIFGIGAWYGVKADISNIDTRVTIIEKSLTSLAGSMGKLADNALTDARQEEKLADISRRLARIDTRLDRLERQ